MADYGEGNRSRSCSVILVLLLSMVTMIMISGCGDQNFAISGTVTSGGSALSGVTVTLSGDASMTTTTDADGNYEFSAVKEGTFVVTPSLTGCTFVPRSRNVYLFGIDAREFNFSSGGESRVAAGGTHTAALKSDGTVRAWGDNSNGQLGDGTTNQGTTPVKVNDLSDVMAIAGGNAHTVAVKSDGAVWAWGNNSNGQLGDGTATQGNTPVQVQSL